MGDLPSQPPVIKVLDFTLQVREVTAGTKEGAEPGRNWFDGVLLAMPNHVSLSIQVNNIWGLIGTLALMVAGDSAIIQPLNPLGRAVDSVTQRNVELRNLPIIDNVSVGGSLKLGFVMLDMVVEPLGLFLEVAHLDGCSCFVVGDGVIVIYGCWAEALELQCQHQALDRMSRVCVCCGIVRVKFAAEKQFSSLVFIASLQVCNTLFHP